jgi:hypothetical protein
MAPAFQGTHVAFFGAGSGGQQGVYVSISQDSATPSEPVKIADKATAIPGGTGNFVGFRGVSINDTDVALLGLGTEGQQGIYHMRNGMLVKVIDLNDTLGGRAITGLNLSRGLLPTAVAFQATFADGSQGVFTASLPAVLVGDFNGDGVVNDDDLVSWESGFGPGDHATRAQGDSDRDEDVDGADFLAWQRSLGSGQVGGASSAVVPEPSLATLFLTGYGAARVFTRAAKFAASRW